MAKIDRVDVRVSRKISEDYNSTEYSVGVGATLEEGDDHESIAAELIVCAKAQVKAAFGVKSAANAAANSEMQKGQG